MVAMTGKQATTTERDEMKRIVLATLAGRGTVGEASRAVGVNRSTLYDWRNGDEEFSAAWAAITEDITDRLEQTAIDYALDGYTEIKTITEDGQVRIEEHHKKAISTLHFMLGARRSQYKAKQEIEHTGEVGVKRIIWGDKPEPTPVPEGDIEE